MSASVLKPAAKRNEILAALQQALTQEFKASIKDLGTPFGTAGFAKKATAELINHQISTPPKKKFWEQAK